MGIKRSTFVHIDDLDDSAIDVISMSATSTHRSSVSSASTHRSSVSSTNTHRSSVSSTNTHRSIVSLTNTHRSSVSSQDSIYSGTYNIIFLYNDSYCVFTGFSLPGQVEDIIVEVITPPPCERPSSPFNLRRSPSPTTNIPKPRKVSATVANMFSSESYEERRRFGTADIIHTLGVVTKVLIMSMIYYFNLVKVCFKSRKYIY